MPRFWSKVNKTETCWLWTGNQYTDGYPQFWYAGRSVRGTRFVYTQTYGPFDPVLLICHKCDTPLCVRPDHLWLGTQQENIRDAWRKGRATAHWTPLRGAKNGMTKLTPVQVADIRARYHPGVVTLVDLARTHGVSKYAVWCVLKRLTWAHL